MPWNMNLWILFRLNTFWHHASSLLAIDEHEWYWWLNLKKWKKSKLPSQKWLWYNKTQLIYPASKLKNANWNDWRPIYLFSCYIYNRRRELIRVRCQCHVLVYRCHALHATSPSIHTSHRLTSPQSLIKLSSHSCPCFSCRESAGSLAVLQAFVFFMSFCEGLSKYRRDHWAWRRSYRFDRHSCDTASLIAQVYFFAVLKILRNVHMKWNYTVRNFLYMSYKIGRIDQWTEFHGGFLTLFFLKMATSAHKKRSSVNAQ